MVPSLLSRSTMDYYTAIQLPLLCVVLFYSQSAHALIQHGVGDLGFEIPVISSTTACRFYISQDKRPFWRTNHPPTHQQATAGGTGASLNSSTVAPIFELWRDYYNIAGSEILNTDLITGQRS